ncbi:unnamed protein product [Arctia plantaginis]|uniref:Uncharacterized protein n=1 Tax=Arctia plantaginis TaxID=874455 RepID=A0A8S1AI05_ARCPL|nr:unnamed protein product [Arctia plantaginis]
MLKNGTLGMGKEREVDHSEDGKTSRRQLAYTEGETVNFGRVLREAYAGRQNNFTTTDVLWIIKYFML